MTSVEEEEPEHTQDQDPASSLGEAAPSSNGSFSESLRLFQSIQVLANEEDRAALQNSTAESRTHKTLIKFMAKMCYCQEFWWRRMTTASPP